MAACVAEIKPFLNEPSCCIDGDASWLVRIMESSIKMSDSQRRRLPSTGREKGKSALMSARVAAAGSSD